MLSRFSVCSVARALKMTGGGEPQKQKEPPGPATVTAPLQTAAAQPQQVVTVVKMMESDTKEVDLSDAPATVRPQALRLVLEKAAGVADALTADNTADVLRAMEWLTYKAPRLTWRRMGSKIASLCRVTEGRPLPPPQPVSTTTTTPTSAVLPPSVAIFVDELLATMQKCPLTTQLLVDSSPAMRTMLPPSLFPWAPRPRFLGQEYDSMGEDLACAGLAGQQQRTVHPAYKTKLCHHFERWGSCTYGDECAFAHGISDIRPYQPTPYPRSTPIPIITIDSNNKIVPCTQPHPQQQQQQQENAPTRTSTISDDEPPPQPPLAPAPAPAPTIDISKRAVGLGRPGERGQGEGADERLPEGLGGLSRSVLVMCLGEGFAQECFG
ncbi:unnamed protein product [Vitrella brassicaformis CCMP3155]|uniref:C3H1-type domain-containing protein n=1 Tax=Vitrella brassicaformis (strain CCMP3155) TaxID=1169540 RepID=A0A0G4FV18_VITBC|nr:unnamed protein product [Vitrella brassicaformis CCMP3155]|eukprot:CEM18808.1 unnamed protein product [Vitrella brassicaformis CCMP3155]